MKKLERILGLVFIITLILKLLWIPYGEILFSLTMLTLAFIYYPMGFAFFNEIRLRKVFKKKSYEGKPA